MTQWFMITAPRGKTPSYPEGFWEEASGNKNICKRVIKIMLEENDIHDWTIGFETGKHGYAHWQIRVKVGCPDDFHSIIRDKQGTHINPNSWMARNMPGVHIEESSDDSCGYERKEGNFISSMDTNSVRSVRFGTLKPQQRDMLRKIQAQSDREITVFYDAKGSHGKSWMCIHLWERGEAVLVPRYACTGRGVSQFVCSVWTGQPYIFIDIPRAGKIPEDLYESIEALKDGVVYDERYHGRAINIRGTKVAVFTNQILDADKLSEDRWDIHGTKNYKQIHPKKKKKPSFS